MSYTLSTPFGNIPGQVSPAEQMQAQTAARMRSQAMADDAQSAQMHVLKQAMAGGGGDDFFSPNGPFGNAPKDTGAVNLAQRNAMVDQRQQGTAAMRDMLDLQKPHDYLTATDRGDEARAQYKFDQGEMGIDTMQQNAFKNELQRQLGGQGAAPVGPMNPNLTPGLNLKAMGGGTAGASPGSDADYMRLAILGAYRNKNGGGVADMLKNRDDAALRNRQFDRLARHDDLDYQKQTMDVEAAKRATAKSRADEALAAGDPERAKQIAAEGGVSTTRASPDAVAASRPSIVEGVQQIVRQGKAGQSDQIPAALQALVKELTDGGVDQRDAAAYLRSKLEPLLPKAGVNWGDFVDNTIGFGFGGVGDAQRAKSAERKARLAAGLPE